MSEHHAVTLPHPDRTEPTVGTCLCGWTVVYAWGGHNRAQAKAELHITRRALAEPVVLEQFGGKRFVQPGQSL